MEQHLLPDEGQGSKALSEPSSHLFDCERRIFDHQDGFKSFVSRTLQLLVLLETPAAQGQGAPGDKWTKLIYKAKFLNRMWILVG